MSSDTACIVQEFIRALELALHETSSPLSIAEECLTQRENRTGVDRVHDDVELALTKVRRESKHCPSCFAAMSRIPEFRHEFGDVFTSL